MMRNFTYLMMLLQLLSGCVKENIKATADDELSYDPSISEGIIIFDKSVAGISDLFRMDEEGNSLVNLTNSSAKSETKGVISHDARKLAYIAEGDVFVSDIDGTDEKNISNNNAFSTNSFESQYISWSSKSNYIVTDDITGQRLFYLMTEYNEEHPEIFVSGFTSDSGFTVLNASFSEQNLLCFLMMKDGWYSLSTSNYQGDSTQTIYTSDKSVSSAKWSHDGLRIVFVAGHDICVVDADGDNFENLTDGNAINGSPCFSPNDDQIVFSKLKDGNSDIFKMNIDGSNPVNLTNTLLESELHPFWN